MFGDLAVYGAFVVNRDILRGPAGAVPATFLAAAGVRLAGHLGCVCAQTFSARSSVTRRIASRC